MSTLVGKVNPFDSESQLWEEYIEMMEYVFQVNDIEAAEKKKAAELGLTLIAC